MNKTNSSFQRNQLKPPSLHKLLNSNSNGLSSPFPFADFGLSTTSSLNTLLTNFSQEIIDQDKSHATEFQNDIQKDINIGDPYLKPLSLNHLKSTQISNKDDNNNFIQYGSHVIKFPPNYLQNNEFSANYFLRFQSTRKDMTESHQKKSNDILNVAYLSNYTHKLNREKRPTTSILTPKHISGYHRVPKETQLLNNFETFSNVNNENTNKIPTFFPRPTTAGSILKISKDVCTKSIPVVEMQNINKFYVKSFKTDALIYNPANKSSSQHVNGSQLNSNQNNTLTIPNSQSLYLQVKQDVEEYRKQRRKEIMLDIEYPEIKSVSEDVYLRNSNNYLENQKQYDKTKDLEIKPQSILNGVPKKCEQSSLGNNCNEISIVNSVKPIENGDSKIYTRPKSVTFNDKIETKDFFDKYSSSESDNEDENEASSTDNESHGSIVSTESDDEFDDQIKETEETKETSESTFFASAESLHNRTTTPLLTECVEDSNKENKFLITDCNVNKKVDSIIDFHRDLNDDECGSVESSSTNDSLFKEDKINNIESVKENIIPRPNVNTISRPVSAISNSNSNSCQQSQSSFVTSKPQVITEKVTKKSTNGKGNNIPSKQELYQMNITKNSQNHSPLIFSKFANVPPVINFVGEGEKINQLPWQLRKLLRWRTSLLTPVIVKQIIARSGFRPSRLTCSSDDLDSTESNDWILYFGKHMKGPVFKTIKEYQKVNHFPGSFQLGRKDRLWSNIYRMQKQLGNNEFDFIPQTFCLPCDLELFKQCWESGGNRHKWIIKPPASARGLGVKVVYKWNQIPKRRSIIVQRYISNPYLINDSKFDLRLYVFITDINPLKIYLYDDGLVRFASTKYSNSVKTLHNRFVHLTNYSINKQNIEYIDNNDNEACKGHKWSLKSLWIYLKKRGVNTDNVWHKIKDLVIKTMISAENAISSAVSMYCKSNYSVQELFGFDVILDENLQPWILEVNVSPSLHSDSPLDVTIKSGMIKDMFNLSGLSLPEPTDVELLTTESTTKSIFNSNVPSSDVYIDRRFWLYEPSEDEIAKMKHFVSVATNGTEYRFDSSDNLPYQILDCLTPKDIRCLIQCMDEYERKGDFERVYPVCSLTSSKKYLSYFERIHYSNLLITSFLTKYGRNNQGMRLLENLCQKKLHLLSAHNGDIIDSKHIWKAPSYSGNDI